MAFGLESVIGLSLFLLSLLQVNADSTALAKWQFCESQDRISSVMNHVALVQGNPVYAELSVSKIPLVFNHVTHSSVCYSSNSADLLSTSDPIIEKQEVVDLLIF